MKRFLQEYITIQSIDTKFIQDPSPLQAGKEGRDHTHAREHIHQGSNRAQDATETAKDHIHAGADKTAQATKDTASKTADGSKSTFQVCSILWIFTMTLNNILLNVSFIPQYVYLYKRTIHI